MEEETDLTPIEQMTKGFYRWEKRSRGWQVYDYPVDIEPVYEPYFLGPIVSSPIKDDGRKPTFFSSIIESFKKAPQSKEDLLLPSPDEEYELTPDTFNDQSQIKEVRLSLLPKQKFNLEATEQFLLALSYCSLPLSFEIIGQEDSISIQFACRAEDLNQLKQQLKAYFPEAILQEEGGYLGKIWDKKKDGLFVEFGLSQEFMRPLSPYHSFTTDPLAGIVSGLENLGQDEVAMIQVLFQASCHPWSESILRSVTNEEGKSFFMDAPEMVSLAREKVRRPLFGAVIRVACQSPEGERHWEIARGLASSLSLLARPESNELIPLTNHDYDNLEHQEDLLLRRTHRSGMLLNSEELVSLIHLPSIAYHTPKLHQELKKTKPSPAIASGHQLVLGENYHQTKSSAVSLSVEQRLRHTYVIGATGTGKSTLLLNLIKQDIEQGHGVGVLDPHGDLIDRILGYIPEERYEDVILFDPSDTDYPVSFNILTAYSEVEKNILASDLGAVFRRLSTSWGDQMTSVLGNGILAFLESEKGGTLADLRRFLIEKEYREEFLKTVKDQEVVYYWQKEFPLLAGKPQVPILTRLDTFLRPKIIRNMVSQREGLNFENILNTKKIFLAKLGQGLIGEENAYLLGSFIVSKIHQSAMARQAKEISERKDFFLYIDEFHNFMTPSMAQILSGARKYHLGLTLAHQELRQLWNRDQEVANSVISNPGTRICFRLGDFDAQKLQDGFSYFKAEDLQNLGVGEAVCRVERPEYDFNLKVLAPIEISQDIVRQKQDTLINLSRQKYALPREEVEAKLDRDRAIIREPENPLPPKAEKAKEKPVKQKYIAPTPKEEPIKEEPVLEVKGESEHRYLQSLIKKMAEEKGYRAIVEQPTSDGLGKVDVGLEYNGKKIACEIALTTTEEHELKNIDKCLKSGYYMVLLCSPDRRNLEKIKELASKEMKEADLKKVLFLQPEEVYFFLEEEAAKSQNKEERIKGYKVKINYRPVLEKDKKSKREMISQVILQAMRRMKGKKQI